MSIKLINKLLLILLVCTSAQASNIHEDRIKTYFNLRDLMQDAEFSFENNKITATFGNNLKKNKKLFKINNSINYITSKYSIDGEINKKDEGDNVTRKYGIYNKYYKALFLISNQETLSVLNYKINNNLSMNEVELDIFSSFDNIKNNNNIRIYSSTPYSTHNYNLLEQIDDEPYIYNSIYFP